MEQTPDVKLTHNDHSTKPLRAVWVFVAIWLGMLFTVFFTEILILAQGDIQEQFQVSRQFLQMYAYMYEIYRLLLLALIGCTIYILAAKLHIAFKIIAPWLVFVALVMYNIMQFGYRMFTTRMIPFDFVTVMQRMRGTSTIFDSVLLFNLISAIVMIGLGVGIIKIIKVSEGKKIAISAACVAVVAYAASFFGRFMPHFVGHAARGGIRAEWTWFGHRAHPILALEITLPMAARINLLLSYFALASLLFCSVLFVHSICNAKSKKLVVGRGAAIWLTLVIVMNIVVSIVAMLSGWSALASVFLTVLMLVGIVIMFTGRRVGWYVYLSGVGLALVFSITSVVLVQNVRAPFQEYLLSLIFVINPIITWVLLRKKWGLEQSEEILGQNI